MLWYSCVTVVLVCWVTIVASRTWEEGDLRLVGGPRRYMGTVVILHNGKWGSVCDDQWEMQDAYVVCRQLGYTRAIRAATRSEFGPGNRRFWLSQVHCKGNEQRLDECSFKGYNQSIPNQCTGRYRSAGVICGVAVSPATSSVSTVEKAVSDTPTTKKNKSHLASAKERTTSRRLSGRTEIKRKKEVKLVQTNSVLTMTTPAVLTQHTTTLASTTWASETAITGGELLASSTPITTKSILQTITDIQLTPSTSSPLYVASKNNIEHDDVSENVTYQDSQVQPFIIDESHDNNSDVSNNSSQETFFASTSLCSLASLGSNKTSDGCDVLLADDPKAENLEIRLTGGRYEWEGYVQVRTKEGAWGTICSDSWTLREAMVTCHQLGVYGKAKQALLTSYFGGMDAPKTIYRTQCIGRESNLALCNLTWSDSEHVCSKETAVAGVTCSQHLPDLIPSLRDIEESIRLQDQPLYYLRCAMEENCLASSAYLIRNTSSAWGNNMRRLLRFSTIVHNRGLADFRPYRPRGQWEWHACHMHYHSMEVFAHYDIIDQKGNRLAEGSKASFCLEDTTCDKGVRPQYNCRGFADQGLSVNCSDNYLYDIDCQWIDISDIKPGEYTFQLEVNPTMLVAESNFDNNVVSCRLFYSGYFASFKNCHHESLLDYRENVRH